MKNITILLTIAFCVVFSNNCFADSYNYKPYIGADYSFNQTKAEGFNPHYNIGGLHIGSDYSQYFGTELFANQSNRDKRSNKPEDIRTSNYNYGLDLLAYLPIIKNKLSLLASAGIGEYVYKTKFSPVNRWHEHGYGYRFAGGLKYVLNEHWQARIIGRYINFDKLSGYKHATEYSIGAEYHF